MLERNKKYKGEEKIFTILIVLLLILVFLFYITYVSIYVTLVWNLICVSISCFKNHLIH